PSPSTSNVRLLGVIPPRLNRTVRGAAPAAGKGRKVGAVLGDADALTTTLWLVVAPVAVVRVAVNTCVSVATGTWTANLPACTAATVPLTATPTSRPPVSSVPCTRSVPVGTVVPVVGEVIVTCRPETVKLRETIALSLPAWSRAY